jgi:hypothetical protein
MRNAIFAEWRLLLKSNPNSIGQKSNQLRNDLSTLAGGKHLEDLVRRPLFNCGFFSPRVLFHSFVDVRKDNRRRQLIHRTVNLKMKGVHCWLATYAQVTHANLVLHQTLKGR